MELKMHISILICLTFFSLLLSKSVLAQSSTEALIAKLQQQIQALQQQVTKLQSEVSSTKTELELVKTELKFTKALKLGTRGEEVTKLQEFLKQFPDIYPQGLVTGYFGPLTEIAVRKFQSKQGIDSIGVVGPKTLSKLNELITEGAGKSDIIPPGLLIAPGVQNRLATTTSSVVSSTTTPAGVIPAIPAIPAQPLSATGTSTASATPAIPSISATPAQQASTVITDTMPPTVTFNIKPMAGFTNAIMVDYVITDNVGVLGYQMKIDGTYLGTEIIQSPPGPINAGGSQTLTNGSHIITMVARDAAGNIATQNITVNIPFGSSTTTSTTATSTTTATTDTTPSTTTTASTTPTNTATDTLTISSISVNAVSESTTQGYATVTFKWTTNISADSAVEYTTTVFPGPSIYDSLKITSHSMVTELKSSTTYKYRVKSGSVISDELTLTTPAPAIAYDKTPPVISNLRAENITTSSAQIKWTTDEPTRDFAWWSINSSFIPNTSSVIDCAANTITYTLSTEHCVKFTGLSSGTTYYYQARPNDASNNYGYSNILQFTTTVTASTATSTSSLNLRSQNLSAISQMLNSLDEILKQLSQFLK